MLSEMVSQITRFVEHLVASIVKALICVIISSCFWVVGTYHLMPFIRYASKMFSRHWLVQALCYKLCMIYLLLYLLLVYLFCIIGYTFWMTYNLLHWLIVYLFGIIFNSFQSKSWGNFETTEARVKARPSWESIFNMKVKRDFMNL